jgi:uncharacterized protein (DUF736 family)
MNTNTNTNNTESKNNDWSKREIGALWKKSGPTQKYLSGYLTIDEFGAKTKVNVVVFGNKNKSKDTAPDFRVYLSKEAVKSGSSEVEASVPQKASKVQKTQVIEETEEVL